MGKFTRMPKMVHMYHYHSPLRSTYCANEDSDDDVDDNALEPIVFKGMQDKQDQEDTKDRPCVVCRAEHRVFDCPVFRRLSVDERRSRVSILHHWSLTSLPVPALQDHNPNRLDHYLRLSNSCASTSGFADRANTCLSYNNGTSGATDNANFSLENS